MLFRSTDEQQILDSLHNFTTEELRDTDAGMDATQRAFLRQVTSDQNSEDVEINLTKYKKLYPFVKGVIAANHCTWPAFIEACQARHADKMISKAAYTEDITLCRDMAVYTPTGGMGSIVTPNVQGK